MQWKVSTIVLTGLSALFVTGCSVQRGATRDEVRSLTAEVVRDTVKEQVLVAVHDTIREVTMVTVRQNEAGDTVRVSTVTDRERVRDRDRIAVLKEKREVRMDTVVVERRDSVFVSAPAGPSAGSGTARPPWVQGLKWVFWIVVAVTVLVVIVKFRV